MNNQANPQPNPPAAKKSRAVLKLEAIQSKQADLVQKYATAEAAVSAEKRAAAIKQGLNDFVEMLAQKGPSEIEGIVTMALADNAPAEKLESIQQWTESLKAAASARGAS